MEFTEHHQQDDGGVDTRERVGVGTREHGGTESEGHGGVGTREHRGVDAEADRRPGVPREAEPHTARGARPGRPEPQEKRAEHLVRRGLDGPTPVYGTAQPPRGLSGAMRRFAYRLPEHRARHWAVLMAADRVDVLEHRIGEGVGDVLRGAGLHGLAWRIERNPLPVVLGAMLGGAVVMRALSGGRS